MEHPPYPIPRALMERPPEARALLRGDAAHPNLRGEVLFFPFQSGSLVLVRVSGLPHDGFVGFHIHTGGDCRSDCPEGTFSCAGGHYNPAGAAHPDHAGDLPPLLSSGGLAYTVFFTGRFYPRDIVGRTVVIHAMPDDFHSQPAGNAGARLACGVIDRLP